MLCACIGIVSVQLWRIVGHTEKQAFLLDRLQINWCYPILWPPYSRILRLHQVPLQPLPRCQWRMVHDWQRQRTGLVARFNRQLESPG